MVILYPEEKGCVTEMEPIGPFSQTMLGPNAISSSSSVFLLHLNKKLLKPTGVAMQAPPSQESSREASAGSLLLFHRWQSSNTENSWVAIGDPGVSPLGWVLPSLLWCSVPWLNSRVILLLPRTPNSTTSLHCFGINLPSVSQPANLKWQKTSNQLPRASLDFTSLSQESPHLGFGPGTKRSNVFPQH